MNGDETEDVGDPLRAAFTDHQRAPRDIVSLVAHGVDDLRRLADGSSTVEVAHYDIDEHGVTRYTERVTITAPIINARKENR